MTRCESLHLIIFKYWYMNFNTFNGLYIIWKSEKRAVPFWKSYRCFDDWVSIPSQSKVVLSKIGHLVMSTNKKSSLLTLVAYILSFWWKTCDITTILKWLYYNFARKFEIPKTFLIYFDRTLMGIIFIILVLRLLKKKCF